MIIYEIINKITKNRYIGKTCNFKNRKDRHIKELKNNNHHCVFLQRAWNKYGEDNFEFNIIIDNYDLL